MKHSEEECLSEIREEEVLDPEIQSNRGSLRWSLATIMLSTFLVTGCIAPSFAQEPQKTFLPVVSNKYIATPTPNAPGCYDNGLGIVCVGPPADPQPSPSFRPYTPTPDPRNYFN